MTTKQATMLSVWYDSQEQWDPEDIDPPALRCTASSYLAAAERLADDSDASYGTFIVRDETTGVYRSVELVRSWTVKRDAPTTLTELSTP